MNFKPLDEHAAHQHISKLLEEANLVHALFTRAQLAEAIRQMLAAGDFIKYISQRPPIDLTATEILGMSSLSAATKLVLEERSTIVYIPLREVERLQYENDQLRAELQLYKVRDE